MYKPLLKASNWVLILLLGFLGYSCSKSDDILDREGENTSTNNGSDQKDDEDEDDDEDEPGTIVEYGTPSATYSVKGKVLERLKKEALEQKALADIQVVIEYDRKHIYSWYGTDTVYTDIDGGFASSRILFPAIEDVRIITSDPDKAFLSDTTHISFKDVPFIPDEVKGWHQGTAEKEVTIELDRKTE